MNPATWDETNGYETTRIYSENAVATVSTDMRLQEGECMAGLKGKSGPPGNMNAFKHGLAAIQKRREDFQSSCCTETYVSLSEHIVFPVF